MRTAAGVLLGAALLTAACRQPDGPVPTPAGEQENKIGDVARDLQNVAAGGANAAGDLLDDLDSLDPYPRPRPMLNDLVQALEGALRQKPLGDEQARQIASVLFVAATARELSPRQIDRLGEDVREAVVKAGGAEADADRVARAAMTLAGARSENRKRWYHLM